MCTPRARSADHKLTGLRRCTTLAACSDDALLRIAAAGDVGTFEPDQDIVSAGEKPRWVYLVLAGEAVAVGEPPAIVTGPGGFIGDLAAVAACPAPSTVRARSTTEVLAFRGTKFVSLLDEIPAIRSGLQQSLRVVLHTTVRPPASTALGHAGYLY